MDEHADARAEMVERQLIERGIADTRVLDSMRQVPRHAFVAPELEALAYHDTPLPIAAEQTISQPYMVARMLEAAMLQPGDRVLDIGTGSGYAAAVMARIVSRVESIERLGELADAARATFDSLGIANIAVHLGDGTLGLPFAAPFDAIIAAAGAPVVPPALREQLKVGGRLVLPVGDAREMQQLVKITRIRDDEFEEKVLEPVLFVPLIGAAGWPETFPSGV